LFFVFVVLFCFPFLWHWCLKSVPCTGLAVLYHLKQTPSTIFLHKSPTHTWTKSPCLGRLASAVGSIVTYSDLCLLYSNFYFIGYFYAICIEEINQKLFCGNKMTD
jgi:hypothetical protein